MTTDEYTHESGLQETEVTWASDVTNKDLWEYVQGLEEKWWERSSKIRDRAQRPVLVSRYKPHSYVLRNFLDLS